MNSVVGVEITAAIVDRLTFGGKIIETGSDSYRLTRTVLNQTAPAPTPADRMEQEPILEFQP
jgi:hypothetical protein